MRRAERLAWRWKISFVSCRLDKDYVEILSYVTMWCPVCCNGEVGYNIKAVFCLMWCYQSTRQAFDKLTHTLILHSAFTLNWTLFLNSFISYEWLAYSCTRHLGGGGYRALVHPGAKRSGPQPWPRELCMSADFLTGTGWSPHDASPLTTPNTSVPRPFSVGPPR